MHRSRRPDPSSGSPAPSGRLAATVLATVIVVSCFSTESEAVLRSQEPKETPKHPNSSGISKALKHFLLEGSTDLNFPRTC